MLGTPDETIWPGVTQLPDYTSRFPRWDATNLGDVLSTFDDDAKDLISVRIEKKLYFAEARWNLYAHMHVFFMFVENADIRS